MKEPSRGRPRRLPEQERSRGLVDAILEGASRVINAAASRGTDDARITTNGIAEAAGVSIGSLYQYFTGKESIFAALVRRRLRQTHDELLEVIESSHDMPIERAVSRLVDRIVTMKLPASALDAALFRAAVRHGLSEESFAFDAEYTQRFAAALDSWKPQVRPDLPSAIAATLLFQGLRAVMVVGAMQQPELVSDPRFRAELEKLLLGYLANPSA